MFFLFVCFLFVCLFFCYFRAESDAYGGSLTRGRVEAVATGLCHSNSNSECELRL